MRVVIFSPTDSYTPTTLPGLTDADVVTVVRWQAEAGVDDSTANRICVRQRSLSATIASVASGNVLTRMFIRVLPFDTGARFWRATRSEPTVVDAVRRADILVAPERDGGFATWSWYRLAARKGHETVAVAGYPAARTAIESAR